MTQSSKRSFLAKCPCIEISLVLAVLFTLPLVLNIPETGFWRNVNALYKALTGWGRYAMPLFLIAVGVWFDQLKRTSNGLRPDRDDFILLLFVIIVISASLHQFALWRFENLSTLELWRMGDGGGVIGASILNLGYTLAGRTGALALSIFLWLAAAILFGGLLYKRFHKA